VEITSGDSSRVWSRLVAVGLVVGGLLMLSMATAERAAAGSVTWDCGILAPHTYCPYPTPQYYVQVWATYGGPGELRMTARLKFASDGRLWGEAWGQGNNGTSVKLFAYRFNTVKAAVSNNHDLARTVVGTAVW